MESSEWLCLSEAGEIERALSSYYNIKSLYIKNQIDFLRIIFPPKWWMIRCCMSLQEKARSQGIGGDLGMICRESISQGSSQSRAKHLCFEHAYIPVVHWNVMSERRATCSWHVESRNLFHIPCTLWNTAHAAHATFGRDLNSNMMPWHPPIV